MESTNFLPPEQQFNSSEPQSSFTKVLGRNFIVVIILVLLLAGAAYGGIWYWQKQQLANEVVSTFTPRVDVVANWKTYRNEEYGFEFKYPSNVELSDWPALSYGPPSLSPVLSLCFPSTIRDEFYCEFEVYVIFGGKDKLFIGDQFLGFNQCPNDKSPPQKKFDGIQGQEVDTCQNEIWYRNAFVEKDGLTYLFVLEPMVGNIEIGTKDNLFYKMIDSFKFNPETAKFCGGLAGIACPVGYECKLDGNYPDAGGKCVSI